MKKTLKFLSSLTIIYFIFFSVFLLYLSRQKTPLTTIVTEKFTPIPTSVVPSLPPEPTSASQIKSKPVISPTRSIQPTPTVIPVQPTPTQSSPDLFAQVPSHNTKEDCWMIISGHIYNFTSYFGRHPGGDGDILKYCGKDGTLAFMTKDKSPASGHSTAAQSMLQPYMIQ